MSAEVVEYFSDSVRFKGPVGDQVISTFLKNVKDLLQQKNIQKRDYKSIYSVTVELVENVLRHGKKINGSSPNVYGEIAFEYLKEHQISLSVLNAISDLDYKALSEKFTFIEDKTVSQIKDVYRHELIHGSISERGGAGLGIYVMAIKAKKAYTFQFEKVDPTTYNYFIKVVFDELEKP